MMIIFPQAAVRSTTVGHYILVQIVQLFYTIIVNGKSQPFKTKRNPCLTLTVNIVVSPEPVEFRHIIDYSWQICI